MACCARLALKSARSRSAALTRGCAISWPGKELEAIVTPLLDARNAMRLQLAKLHRLALTAARSDSAVGRMMTVPGVGASWR
ncbi:hypothetical protein ACVWXL_009053 [Bradyrhizobium sp. GM22.5]